MFAVLFITTALGQIDFSVGVDSHCPRYGAFKLYKTGLCKKNKGGSIMMKESWVVNTRAEYQYDSPDCSGQERSKTDMIFSQCIVNPPARNYIAFRADEETDCSLDDTVDGTFYISDCYSDQIWRQWKVFEENGKHYLRRIEYNAANSCTVNKFTSYTGNYECNKCDKDGRLTKCYNVGKVGPWTDFTMRGPEDTLGPEDAPTEPDVSGDDTNGDATPQKDSSVAVAILFGLLVLTFLF